MLTPFGELPDRFAGQLSMAEQYEWLSRPVSRRNVLRAGGAAGAALLGPTLWTQRRRNSGTVVYGRHLAYGADPRTSMNLSFAVNGAFSSAAVCVAAGDAGGFTVPAVVNTVRGSTRQYCRAEIGSLRPDTSYSYQVLIDGAVVTGSSLRTAPSGPTPFRFTAFGDQGVGVDSRLMLRQLVALRPRLHLLAGDLCYADSSGGGRPTDVFHPAIWDYWLQQNGAVASNLPWMCAMGNHEMEPGFGLHGYAGVLARVPMGGASPLQVPSASVFQVGNVGFVCLDSNDVSYEIPENFGWTHGAQTAWLGETLARLRAPDSGVEFIVAYMHHSAYCTNTSHGSEGGIRQFWVPLFDQYQVDLVISGHNHCYERTQPLREGNAVADGADVVDSRTGTTYVTAGGGGQHATPVFLPGRTKVSGPGGGLQLAPWAMPSRTGDHAVLCVDVIRAAAGRPSELSLRAVDIDGRVIDAVRLSRSALPSPTRGSDAGLAWLAAGGGVAAAALAAGAWSLHRRGAVTDTSERPTEADPPSTPAGPDTPPDDSG